MTWPVPRFSDNLDGTVTDNLTGLTWLQDANCFGEKSWDDALGEILFLSLGLRNCANYNPGTFTDWRLPNIREFSSLMDFSQHLPALPTSHPFLNVQLFYWSSSTSAQSPGSAWNIYMFSGSVATNPKHNGEAVWPVRGGL